MSRRRLALGTAAALLAVAGGWLALAPPPAPVPSGPNVLFIVWDTVRADRLSLYGHHRATTPRLDAFAQEAVVFERAISPAIWTPPSHASMFTGFAPHHHGVKATYKWLDHAHETLAERLGGAGWDTFVFSANPYIAPDTNLTQGFDAVTSSFSAPWRRAARDATRGKLIPRDASTDISPAWKGRRTVGEVHPFKDAAPVAHEALVDWLTARPDPERPWFAFLNLMEAHIPRIPSMASRRALLDDATIERGLTTPVSQIDLLAYTFGKREYTPAELDAIQGVYDAAVRDLDAATGDLLDDLRARGLLDDTVVVLTSDHGENLGDHHMFGHKFSLWDTLIRVPLVIWWPDHLAPRRVETPVSNLALFATVLDVTGVGEAAPFPDLRGSLLDRLDPQPLFAELEESTPVSIRRIDRLYGLDDKARWLRTLQSVEEDGWKLIRASDGTHELYRIPDDPGELHDVAPEHPDRVDHLGRTLDAWRAAVPGYDPAQRTPDDQPATIDAATREMLERLGYLSEDEGLDED